MDIRCFLSCVLVVLHPVRFLKRLIYTSYLSALGVDDLGDFDASVSPTTGEED